MESHFKQREFEHTNHSANGTADDGDGYFMEDVVTERLSARVTFGIIYCTIFAVGICGNALVVTAVLRTRRMRTTTNLLISNLALSDIIFTIFMLFTPYATFFPMWPFGDVLCRIIAMASCCTVFVSSFTSTVIAVDRYIRIVHPLVPRLRAHRLPVVIVAIWLASIAISSPLAVAHGVSVTVDGNTICNENWPSPSHRRVFGVATICFQFIVPSVIITFCYVRVLKRITERLKKRSFIAARNPERELHELRHKQRVTRMLLAMVGQFAGCWIFFNLYHILDDLVALDMHVDYDTHTLLFLIVYIIASSSVVYNPFIYGWMNENFRKEFVKMLVCTAHGKQRTGSSSVVDSRRVPRVRAHLQPISLVVVAADTVDDCVDCEHVDPMRTYTPSPNSPGQNTQSMTLFVSPNASPSRVDQLLLTVSLSVVEGKQCDSSAPLDNL